MLDAGGWMSIQAADIRIHVVESKGGPLPFYAFAVAGLREETKVIAHGYGQTAKEAEKHMDLCPGFAPPPEPKKRATRARAK